MKVIVPPKSPKDCINVSELNEKYLIVCYVDGKLKGFISQNFDYAYEFRTNSSFDDPYDPNINIHITIPELICNILEVYPNATFEAYE